VVDGSGPENRRTRKGTEGSKPSLSASLTDSFVLIFNNLQNRFLANTTYGATRVRISLKKLNTYRLKRRRQRL
jgi:hypothetical protein